MRTLGGMKNLLALLLLASPLLAQDCDPFWKTLHPKNGVTDTDGAQLRPWWKQGQVPERFGEFGQPLMFSVSASYHRDPYGTFRWVIPSQAGDAFLVFGTAPTVGWPFLGLDHDVF